MHFLSNDIVNRKDRRKVNNKDVIFTKKLTFLYDMSTCHQISTEINIEDTFNPINFLEVSGWGKWEKRQIDWKEFIWKIIKICGLTILGTFYAIRGASLTDKERERGVTTTDGIYSWRLFDLGSVMSVNLHQRFLAKNASRLSIVFFTSLATYVNMYV